MTKPFSFQDPVRSEPDFNGTPVDELIYAIGAYTGGWTRQDVPKVRDRVIGSVRRFEGHSLTELQREIGFALAIAVASMLMHPMHDGVYSALEDLKDAAQMIAAFLARNGHTPYKQYLQTQHWQKTREAAIERAGDACQLCSSTAALNVHHNNYTNLFDERPEDVIVLCRHCHAKFHDKLP